MQAVLLVHEQCARERGEEARHREGPESGGAHADPHRRRGAVVLADCDERAAGMHSPQHVHGEHGDPEHREAEQVERGLAAHVDEPEQVRALDA